MSDNPSTDLVPIDGIYEVEMPGIEERLLKMETQLSKLCAFADLVTNVLVDVGPIVKSLEDSPILKMLGGKRK